MNESKTMKKTLIPIFGLALILLPGCVVLSVYPFFSEKDLVFEPALVGNWVDADTTDTPKESWHFEPGDQKGYLLTTIENGKTNRSDAHLFRLKKQLFLDLRTRPPEDNSETCLPMHQVLKVSQIEPTLQLRPLAYDWLEKLIEKNPRAIRHMVYHEKTGDTNGTLILTADTKELQKLILKYSGDTNAFKELSEMRRLKD
jgi:hypothetical protein